jgi:hypothetical protein
MRLPRIAYWTFVSLFTALALVAPKANSQERIASNAGNSVGKRRSGTNLTATSDLVSLAWQASTSEDVVGYNVYRGKNSGGPYHKINHQLDSDTAYTDNRCISGRTYYYVTTAVNSAGEESTYSNEAQATIP